ncbi:MAG: signal peptide peptidase SppA [bacterium]
MKAMQDGTSNTGFPAKKARKSHAWVWVLALVVGLPVVALVALAVLVVCAVVLIEAPQRHPGMGADEFPVLRETWSYGGGDTKVVRIPLKGVLVERDDGGPFYSRGPVEIALRQIRAATADDEVKAIILEVDSPGGGLTASDLIYKALVDFRAGSPDRRVVALLGDIAASGGYYVTTAADYIVAHPTTITGSLGVIISKVNVKKLGDEYGVKLETIKSGRNKDILSPFADLSDEQRVVLQEVVDEMQGRFVGLVLKARPAVAKEVIPQLTDGRVYTSSKALEYKLIDEIGYWDDAVARTGSLLGVDEVKVVRYNEEFSFSALLAGAQEASFSAGGLLDKIARARVMSLWQW